MISCEEAREYLWDHLESPVRAVADHLQSCETCCGEADFLGRLVQMLAAFPDEDIPPAVRTRLEAVLSAR